tara:strand:- start:2099 stop:2752 length:654 start_codon:yes stop_codon:yes gene_type:complete
MKQLAFILFCLLISPAALYAAETSAQTYETLVSAAKRGDQPVDWTAIRLAYAQTPTNDFSGVTVHVPQNEMMAALQAKDYATAATRANAILDKYYASLFAHRALEIVYGAAGDKKLEKQYHDNVGGIIDSIANHGDGKSKEKSFLAVSIAEEYQMLTMLGLEPKGQSLIAGDPNGHSYDVLKATNADGKEYEIYFQIDSILAAENRLVEGIHSKAKE